MSGETNLARLLQSMTPQLNPGQYVFCCVPAEHDCRALQPLASMRESEGLSLVLTREIADIADLVENALRAADDLAPRLRELRPLTPSLDELHAELLLQILDLHGERGLRHGAVRRGLAEMPVPRNGVQIAKLLQ